MDHPKIEISTRMRRNRQFDWTRKLVRETQLHTENLIWPIFIHDGTDSQDDQPIGSMPGVVRFALKNLVKEARIAHDLGIPAVALFPKISPKLKNSKGTEALRSDNLICKALSTLKEALPDLGLIADVALDPYTDHGHDGVLSKTEVDNDATLEILAAQALNQARAGADIVAPSDMMDGRVGFIRKVLDSEGFKNTLILSYAAKYASAFYGPFRDAVGSGNLVLESDKKLGFRDKRTYQMDPANSDEALREVALDIEEGADMVMVKPGMPYLDIVYRIKSEFKIPTFVYQVSGEYSALMAASQNSWLNAQQVMMESLLAFRRAGADGILTYFAREAAHLLKK